jgi:putative transposase
VASRRAFTASVLAWTRVPRTVFWAKPEHPRLSVVRQWKLVSISRSEFYYGPAREMLLNLTLMRLIDEQFLEAPWYGSRQMARHL